MTGVATAAPADPSPATAARWTVVLAVVLLAHGPEAALRAAQHVMALYGETFAQYCEEFKCPTP